MKIAFVVGEFPSLSQTFILSQITGLIDRGHQVDIYANVGQKQPKIHPDVEKYDLPRHTHYWPQIPENQIWRLVKGTGLVLTHSLKDPVLLGRSLNFLKYGKEAASFRLLYPTLPLLQERPSYDIIHCHFGWSGLQSAFLRDIGALRGKLITTFHGFDITASLKIFGDRLYDPLFRMGNLFLPISYRWQQRLIELGCGEQKIKVHRMGIDCQKFTFTPRQPDADGSIRLVTIARLVEKKGIEYGIRAVAQLVKTHPNLEYNVVGDGPLRDSLSDLIQSLGIQKHVKLLGWKQDQEVFEILHQAHILLAPSVTSQDGDQEGIPVALMEAMAMGLPVISTLHSGIPELIENGSSGFLVPERDADTLAHKLSYLIEHPGVWPQMGQAGRSYVETHYNINQLNDQLVEIYQQLLLEPC
uniref:glycosyltransferase n=1 Tax=Trichocoleus desertorum TaxID=1481672 RepID=UPI0025B2D462|nr:glycosyltransferase [Trichocoleus desertorum]